MEDQKYARCHACYWYLNVQKPLAKSTFSHVEEHQSGRKDRKDERRERLNGWTGSSREFHRIQAGIDRKTTRHKKTLRWVITRRMCKINHSDMGKEHMVLLEGKRTTLLQAIKD